MLGARLYGTVYGNTLAWLAKKPPNLAKFPMGSLSFGRSPSSPLPPSGFMQLREITGKRMIITHLSGVFQT